MKEGLPSLSMELTTRETEKNSESIFPPITEMYSQLEDMRIHTTGSAEVQSMGVGNVSIDKSFKAVSKKLQNSIDVSKAVRRGGMISELVLQDYAGVMTDRPWLGEGTLKLVEVEKLLHFTFGDDLLITLEGRPIYQVIDTNHFSRAIVRHIGDSMEEVQNPTYTFVISEKGTSFKVQVSSDGTVTVMDSESMSSRSNLSPERPHKNMTGKALIHMLQEGITSLKKNAEAEGRIPNIKLT